MNVLTFFRAVTVVADTLTAVTDALNHFLRPPVQVIDRAVVASVPGPWRPVPNNPWFVPDSWVRDCAEWLPGDWEDDE